MWQALAEYPVARATLLEKGQSLLRKDNLLDEDIAREVEELEKQYIIMDKDLIKNKNEFDVIDKNTNHMIDKLQSELKNLIEKLENIENKIKEF